MEVVDSVARSLLEHPASTARSSGRAVRHPRDVGLSRGLCGVAIFFGYLDRSLADHGHGDTALDLLDEAIDVVSEHPMGPSLFGGFTGIAWAAEHLQRLLGVEGDDDPNASIDLALLDLLRRDPWPGAYDLVGGLVGMARYALDRPAHPTAVTLLERIVAVLDLQAERTAQGLTWFTPPERLPEWQLEYAPSGYYNVGVAHGVPGVIAVLAEICAAGVASSKARSLLEGAVHWLLRQKRAGDAPSLYPDWVGAHRANQNARWGWCYGDQGISAALMHAADCVDEPAWREEAVQLAHHAAAGAMEHSKVVDAGICHGAAGLGHLFHRLYHSTGDAELADASRSWYRRVLAMRREGEGVAGFRVWDGVRWIDDPGFLMGAGGIGLAMLAAVTEQAPDWDRLLLISGRTGR